MGAWGLMETDEEPVLGVMEEVAEGTPQFSPDTA